MKDYPDFSSKVIKFSFMLKLLINHQKGTQTRKLLKWPKTTRTRWQIESRGRTASIRMLPKFRCFMPSAAAPPSAVRDPPAAIVAWPSCGALFTWNLDFLNFKKNQFFIFKKLSFLPILKKWLSTKISFLTSLEKVFL